jgi:hypothetical protein
MSICTSGASTTKPGVASSVVVDSVYVQSLLPPVLSWLYPYLPYMHGLEIGNVGAFCAADPPTFSLPTAAQFYSFITGFPITDAQDVNDFLVALTEAYLWYSLCQCTSGTPPALTPPAEPTGLPALNPPGVVTPPVAPACAGATLPTQSVGAPDSQYTWNTGALVPGIQKAPLPQGATFLTATMTMHDGGASHVNQQFSCTFWTPDGLTSFSNQVTSALRSPSGPGTAPTTFTGTAAVPSGAGLFLCEWSTSSGVCTDTVDGSYSISCGGQPGTLATPCCPPDPIAAGLLNRILTTVTLLQRQVAPFGYVTGAVHAGLHDQGSIAIADLIGLKLEITTLPSSYGRVVGEPVFLFDVGWWTVGTLDGFFRDRRVTSSSMVWLPDGMGAMTLVGYSLSPGVVATITELEREP